MTKYGQAEYVYHIAKQVSEKMLEQGLLTEQQYKTLDEKNKEDCFGQFCTANAA